MRIRAWSQRTPLDSIESRRRSPSSFRIPSLITARLQLGKSFSVTPQAKELVTFGLYSRIRNPIYVFVGVMWLGLIVALRLYWLFAPFAVLLSLQLFRVPREASVLQERFGQTDLDYRKQTWF
jgi:protein-S-isoprenylcysteine O-methyltransferase Ste14